MIVLAFDTSLAACSAAVCDTSSVRCLASRRAAMERGHAEALAPMLRAAMEEARLAFAQVDRIAVTVGPGTFTGVRIGLAMARGLALALERPAIGIGTLAAIALNAPDDLPVAVAIEARRGQIYFALPPGPAKALSPEDAARLLAAGPVRCLGGAADTLIRVSGRGDLIRDPSGDLPDPARFAMLAARLDPTAAPPDPVYLRPPDAKPSNPALAVRPASVLEAPVLAALHAECFDAAWSAADFARLMATPGCLALLAVRGDQPLGFVLLRQAADEADILTLGVHPAARRRGFGRRLVDEALRRAPAVRRLFIDVAAGNDAARALYAKLGFAQTGKREGYYARPGGVSEDAVVLRKDIVP